MDDILFLQTAPAVQVAHVLEICLKHSSRTDPLPVDQWLMKLKDRNDVSSVPIQEAMALCQDYANREEHEVEAEQEQF